MAEHCIPIENQLWGAAAELPVLSADLRSRVLAVAGRERVTVVRRRRMGRVLWATPIFCLCAWNLSAVVCSAWSQVAEWNARNSDRVARVSPAFGNPDRSEAGLDAEKSRSGAPVASSKDNVGLTAADAAAEKAEIAEALAESDETFIDVAASSVVSYSTSEWDLVDEISRVRVIQSFSFGAPPVADKNSEIFGSPTTVR